MPTGSRLSTTNTLVIEHSFITAKASAASAWGRIVLGVAVITSVTDRANKFSPICRRKSPSVMTPLNHVSFDFGWPQGYCPGSLFYELLKVHLASVPGICPAVIKAFVYFQPLWAAIPDKALVTKSIAKIPQETTNG